MVEVRGSPSPTYNVKVKKFGITIMEDSMTDYEYTGSKNDLESIEEVRETHVTALNAGDAATWAAQFTDDGVQMPPAAPANFGRAAIASWSQVFLDMFNVEFALGVEEVRVCGEWAFERGTYTIALKPKPGGPSMQDMGKYITVYQKNPGSGWQMARDIWNSSAPPPQP